MKDAARARLKRTQVGIVVQALMENPGHSVSGHRSAEGDPRRLRGIPAIGHGVAGAIPGTNPEQAVLRRLSVDDLSDTDPPFFLRFLSRGDPPDPKTMEAARRIQERQKNASMRRQARIRGASTDETVKREEIIQRDGGQCYLCGKVCDPKEIHIDHITPVSRGGAHHPDNVAVTCADCNIRKGAKLTEKRPAALCGTLDSPVGEGDPPR